MSESVVGEEKLLVDEVKLVPLSSIVWRSPIRDFTDEDIKNMAASLRIHGQIHPIICKPPDENGIYEGVCGRLRYEGAKRACIPEILVRVHKFESESEVKAWQLAENLHRKELTAIQRAEACKQLYEKLKEEVGGVKDKHIVGTIAMMEENLTGEKPSEKTVWQYIQIANELPEEVKAKTLNVQSFGVGHAIQLIRLKDKPDKQFELVEEFMDSVARRKPLSFRQFKKKIDQILKPKPERLTIPDFLKKVNPIFYEFSIWEVPEKRPEGGMVDYKGNCSPYVCAGCLYNYARKGDVVLDPMAGSGTFLDVAKEMKTSEGKPAFKQIICSDLNPIRSDIIRSDAEKIDLPNDSVDFIFVHFPYWNSVDYIKEVRRHGVTDPDEDNELSRMSLDKFESKSKRILWKLHQVLKTGRNLCLMIGPKRNNGEFLDLPWLFTKWACRDEDGPRFVLDDKIVVMTYNPKKISFKAEGKRHLAIGQGRKNNNLNINYDEVLVLKK